MTTNAADPSTVVPIRKLVELDEPKLKIVREVLARLEAGEQFQGLAILLADNHQYEAPFDGKYFELLTAGVRFVHRMNKRMDGEVDSGL